MHLAEPCSVVTVFCEDFANRTTTSWYQRVVTGIARCEFRNDSAGTTVMVPSGNQRGTSRRAQRGRVEGVVSEPLVGETLKGGVWTGPPNMLLAPKPTSSVRIRRMFGAPFGFHFLGKIGSRVHYGSSNLAFELRLGLRKNLCVHGCCADQEINKDRTCLGADGSYRSSLT